MRTITEKLADILPTGSGIDCSWTFTEQKNSNILAHNSFQCMNERGYYDGFADFTVIFKKNAPLADFVLQFNGKVAQYKNERYMLRDYLEATIYHFIRDIQGDSVVNSNLSNLLKHWS